MLHIFNLLIVLLFLWSPVAGAREPMAAHLTETGRGQAYYLGFIKVYEATLFSSENASVENLLEEDVSKCLHLVYDVGIKQKDLIDAA